MAFQPAQVSRILMGVLSLSGYTKSYTAGADTDMIDTTVLTDTAKTFIPGMDTSTVSCQMLLDSATTASSQYTNINTMQDGATSYPITVAPLGTALGTQLVALLDSLVTNVTYASTLTDAVTVALTSQTTGLTDFGVVLADLAAVTADTNGTSVDNGASTANGGVGHLHVTAFSGFTSNAIRIEHSTDNSVWATLGSFTTATGTTSQRLTIASGTTVNRYLRVVDDVTGTGSCTRAVFFARR